ALIDVGTNAEILLIHEGRIYGTSTPAGPSFEGGGIRWGVRARAGAIEHIHVTADSLSIQTIGHQPAVGVCGSGLVDLLAEGMKCGLLTPAGRFQGEHPNLEWIPPKADTARPADAVPDERGASPNTAKKAPRRRLVLARADQARQGYGVLYITEGEIAQLLQAKAAIFAGFYTLLQAVGIGLEDIDELLLAGGFARHIDLQSAIGCGMLPDVRNIQVVGNTSLAGSLRVILHHHALTTMKDLMHAAQIVELNLEPTFEQNFIDALFLPNVRRKLFPSVPPPPPRRPNPPPPEFVTAMHAGAASASTGGTAP
ncbi:MAG TPA: ATP-binding protein, partial [Planctomycetota bacterium]|nr:ATP-binding protein [Planctomycetota bacterium]